MLELLHQPTHKLLTLLRSSDKGIDLAFDIDAYDVEARSVSLEPDTKARAVLYYLRLIELHGIDLRGN